MIVLLTLKLISRFSKAFTVDFEKTLVSWVIEKILSDHYKRVIYHLGN